MPALVLVACALSCSPSPELPGKLTIGISQTAPTSEPILHRFDDDIRIDNFVVNIAAIEFHRCTDGQPSASSSWSLVPNAFAHVSGDSTRLGSPYVQDFLSSIDGVRVIGEISPPAGDYCGGYIIVSPTDEDAMNLTDIDLYGSSAALRGQYRNLRIQEWTGFELRSKQRRAYPFSLKLLVEPVKQKTITLHFDGVDAALANIAPNDPDAIQGAIESIMNAVEVK